MRNFIPSLTYIRLQNMQQWANLQQGQLSKAILITKDSVLNYIKRQLEKGNYKEVEDVLKGKPMTKAGRFLYEELKGRVVSSLMLRLGLRRVVAAGIALILIPIILAKLSGRLVKMVKK